VSRRAARARMIAAQTQLQLLGTQLDVDVRRFQQQLHPTRLLAGAFAAGFATILLPRRWRAGLVFTFGSVAWPLARLFAPTLLQNFLQNTNTSD
jgi:hypothetical protein